MYTFTNHFSKSELNSRIQMIHQPGSSAVVWLRYPVLFLAVVTIASAFVQPQQVRRLSIFVPKPITEALTNVSVPIVELVAVTDSMEAVKPTSVSMTVDQVQPAESESPIKTRTDSTAKETSHDTVRSIPSRYMQYEGDKLYWLVTPKTSFDDLAAMKQEFERHGYKMQIQNLRYDPLNTYIAAIKVTIIRPVVGISDFEDLGTDGGPIRTHGGYNGINTLKTVAAVGSYPFNTRFVPMPEKLIQLARDEEVSVNEFIQNNRKKYPIKDGSQNFDSLMTAAERNYGHLGIGFRKFDKEEIKKESSPNSSVRVDENGYLSIDNAVKMSTIKAFINNEPASPEQIRTIKIDKIYKLAVILGYDNAKQQRTRTEYFFFYVEK